MSVGVIMVNHRLKTNVIPHNLHSPNHEQKHITAGPLSSGSSHIAVAHDWMAPRCQPSTCASCQSGPGLLCDRWSQPVFTIHHHLQCQLLNKSNAQCTAPPRTVQRRDDGPSTGGPVPGMPLGHSCHNVATCGMRHGVVSQGFDVGIPPPQDAILLTVQQQRACSGRTVVPSAREARHSLSVRPTRYSLLLGRVVDVLHSTAWTAAIL